MLCNLCSKNQATVHLTEIVDEKMTELHLCDDCARKKSMQMEQQFGLSDLLGGLVDYGKQFGAAVEKNTGLAQCPSCGLTYEDFKKIGRIGCGDCYVAFSRYLGPLLRRIHGASQHSGKVPVNFKEPKMVKSVKHASSVKGVDLSALKEQLIKAIEREEFEEAARLRDQIKSMESKENQEKKRRSSKKDDL